MSASLPIVVALVRARKHVILFVVSHNSQLLYIVLGLGKSFLLFLSLLFQRVSSYSSGTLRALLPIHCLFPVFCYYLQKRAVRAVTNSEYRAHTAPVFFPNFQSSKSMIPSISLDLEDV